MGSVPLSGAIQVLLTATSSAADSITAFVRSMRAAHADLVPVTRELSELRLTLELLRSDARNVPPELHGRIVDVLRSCNAVTDSIGGILSLRRSIGSDGMGRPAWSSSEKSEAVAVRTSLQLHREALGVSLEVTNLTMRRDNIAFVTGAEDGADEIKIEADRVLSGTTLLQKLVPQDDDEDECLVSALHQYLDEVVACVEGVLATVSTEKRWSEQLKRTPETKPLVVPEEIPEKEAVTGVPEVVQPEVPGCSDSDKIVVPDGQEPETLGSLPGLQQPLEAAGPWYPPGDGAVPFYREPNPPPIPPRNTHRRTGSTMSTDSHFKRRPVAACEPRPAPSPIPGAAPESSSPPGSERASSQRSYDGNSLFDSPQPSSVRTSTTTMDTAAGSPRPPEIMRTFPHPAPSLSESVSVYSTHTIDEGPARPVAPDGGDVLPARSPLGGALTPVGSLQMELIPSKRLSDKDKGSPVFSLDVSAARSVLASQHGNHQVKIWSLATNTLQSVIKVSAKVKVEGRSRNYFIRSHALVSESMAMVAVSASFGNTLELWNWARRRRVQSIDRAFRWAAVRDDAWRAWRSSLAVYRGEDAEAIDLFDFSRDPGLKQPFRLGARIELGRAGLPFTPKYPELAFSATEPLLVGAAGPRARDPPNAQRPVLVAWHTGQGAEQSHAPWRWKVADHEELHMALPAGLVAHGNVAVSTWLPAGHRPVLVPGGYWNKPVPVTSRYVLVWEMEENRTRLLAIPNVPSALSPDGRLVAYCDAAAGRLAVLETAGGAEVWAWPSPRLQGMPHFSQLDDLARVTDFAFAADGGLLVVGDTDGGIGVYEIWQHGAGGRAARGELDAALGLRAGAPPAL